MNRTTCLLALTLVFAARPALAQTGTVNGRVTNALTGAPVTTVDVAISGTRIGASVDADGRFRLINVPVSAREVVASGFGYKPTTVPFSLTANGTATVALLMTVSAIELNALVVTGSVGDMRRRAVGSSVAVVNARDVVGRSAVPNLTEILQAKVPGLTLMPGSGTVGTAANYRLRGAGSLGAASSPTVYVDGVRVSSRSQGNYSERFGQSTSALDAISVADIESIEVIKGPSAATLYGAEAAAGVIQIFTRRGQPGRIKWESRTELGRSDWDETLRPVNFAVATDSILGDTVNWPGFKGKSLGDVVSFRPMTDGRALRTAQLVRLILSASGGADRYTFFVSASKSDEQGVFYNNFSNLRSLRGNFTFAVTDKLTFTSNISLNRSHIRLPLNDNAGPNGLISSSYLAVPGKSYPFPGGPNYATIAPEVANTYDDQSRADRFTIGASADYAPVPWFRNTFRFGVDANVGRTELYFAPDSRFLSRVSLDFDNSKGLIAQGRPLNQEVTLNYVGTVTHQWSDRLASNTSFGAQYLANRFQRIDAIGRDFGSDALRSVASAALTSSTESSSEQKSFGFYAQQQLALDDRLFVTLATRVDNNSSFGTKLNRVFYPKASVSYVISEAPYFAVPAISSLRLRAAWGQAGNAPGPFDAYRSYTASVVTYSNGTTSALQYASPGNPDLHPERGSEFEAGFESTFLRGRVGLDASYYNKTTHDALIPVDIPPSTGFSGRQLANLGEISNTGIELLLTATPVQRSSWTVDASLSLATNRNKLVSFGDNRRPEIFGFNAPSQRFQEGYPLGALWAQRVLYNPDGTLQKVDGVPVMDSASVYMGPSVPTREMSFATAIVLFNRLRLYGLADYKAGHYQLNEKERRRDRLGISWETANPAADPDEVLVRRTSTFQTLLYIQRADFVKLRDLSLSYDLPSGMLHGVARRATLTVAGHNLKTWTKYGGPDPELNYGGARTFNRDDSWTVPQTRRYSATVALGF